MALRLDMEKSRRIMVLAAPIMIAMLTQTFLNIVDTIFVGKLDSSYSIPGQAALGFSMPILWGIGGFLAALGVGTQSMTARREGAGRMHDAGAVLVNSLLLAVVSSIVMTFVGWWIIPDLFGYLTRNEAVLALGVPYAQVRVLGVLSMVATTSYKGFYDGLGQTRVHMFACLWMNAVNVLLNYVLIYGMGPIPAMYVTGAAVASVISTYVGLAYMLFWSMRKDMVSQFRYYRVSNLSLRTSWEIARLSLPGGAAQVFVMSGVLLFLKVVGIIDERHLAELLTQTHYFADETSRAIQYGVIHATEMPARLVATDLGYTLLRSRPPVYMTAAKLVIDLLTVSFVTCIAFGQATATLVSQAMGQGEHRLAESFGWESVKLGMYIFGVVSLGIMLVPEIFLDVLSDDPLVIQTAVPGLRVMAGNLIFIAMSLILIQALFGAGDTKFVMWAEMILHGICLAPLAWLFAIHLEYGFMGVWFSATVYIAALAAVMAWRFWEGSWKRIEV